MMFGMNKGSLLCDKKVYLQNVCVWLDIVKVILIDKNNWAMLEGDV